MCLILCWGTVWVSSLLRQYIEMYGNGLSGVVLTGTVTDRRKSSLLFIKRLCRLMAAVRGWHYRSRMVDELVTGSFNRKFRSAANPCGLAHQR